MSDAGDGFHLFGFPTFQFETVYRCKGHWWRKPFAIKPGRHGKFAVHFLESKELSGINNPEIASCLERPLGWFVERIIEPAKTIKH